MVDTRWFGGAVCVQRLLNDVSCLEQEEFQSRVLRKCEISRYVNGGIEGLSIRLERREMVRGDGTGFSLVIEVVFVCPVLC